jgi:hypothetical protein
MNWERVYTVNDFYDHPRLGVADFEGKPHIYEAEFSEIQDEYSGLYWLVEIQAELFALVMENWEIWLRWDSAYKQGIATLESHPALPADRQRHSELTQLIGDQLRARSENALVRQAEFRGGKVRWIAQANDEGNWS